MRLVGVVMGGANNNKTIIIFIAHSGIIKSGRSHAKRHDSFCTEFLLKILYEGTGEGGEPSVGVVI